jgi:hypothetical protein
MQPPNQYPGNYGSYYQPAPPDAIQPLPPPPRYSLRGRIVVLTISVFIYAISCALPALEFNDPENPVYFGFHVLIIGWLGTFIGQFGWFANLFLIVPVFLLLIRRWVGAFVGAMLSLGIALLSLMLFHQNVPANEGGTREIQLQHLRIGFYVWLASMVSLGLGALILRQFDRTSAKNPDSF